MLENPPALMGRVEKIPSPRIAERHRDIGRLSRPAHQQHFDFLAGFLRSLRSIRSALWVTAPSSRLDVRTGVAGRADVIEEIARLYSYLRLPRHTPTWPEPSTSAIRLARCTRTSWAVSEARSGSR